MQDANKSSSNVFLKLGYHLLVTFYFVVHALQVYFYDFVEFEMSSLIVLTVVARELLREKTFANHSNHAQNYVLDDI